MEPIYEAESSVSANCFCYAAAASVNKTRLPHDALVLAVLFLVLSCYSYMSSRIAAARTSVFVIAIPLVTAFGAWMLLGETLSVTQFLGRKKLKRRAQQLLERIVLFREQRESLRTTDR